MSRLWVKLSVAFSSVVLLGVMGIVVVSGFISRENWELSLFYAQFQIQGGLVDRLSDYYRTSHSWDGIDVMFAGAEGASYLPLSSIRFMLTDATGQVIYTTPGGISNPPDVTAKSVIPVMVDGTQAAQLTIVHAETRAPSHIEFEVFLQWLSDFLLVVAVVGGVVGILFGVLVSRSLTAPLDHLAEAARRIGARNLSPRVALTGSAEIVDVAKAFNEMAEALQQAETLRRNLVADVAHELRTPLSVLQGNLRAILDNVYPLDKIEVARLYDQTRLLNRLVNDLHELTLAEARQLQLNLQLTDVASVINSAVGPLYAVAELEGVTLTMDISPSLPLLTADPGRLTQVLHNLLMNALRHTPQGGTISVSAYSNDNHQPVKQSDEKGAGNQHSQDSLELVVRDTGEGIAPEQLSRIFDRFYRADRTRSRNTGGTGLGLAIVRAIVEMHHGSISAASDGIAGHGTTFTIQLPVLPYTPLAQVMAANNPSSGRGQREVAEVVGDH